MASSQSGLWESCPPWPHEHWSLSVFHLVQRWPREGRPPAWWPSLQWGTRGARGKEGADLSLLLTSLS